ncbi:ABC transporter permease, partial [bacterium]|nr:ABC transporter permease [bacterium]
DREALGQTLVITFENGSGESFIVRGVTKPFPHKASFRFDFLMGYEKRTVAGLTRLEDWDAFTDATFIQLRKAEDSQFIADQLDRYVPAQNATNDAWQVRSFFLDNIGNPDWLSAWDIENRAMQAPLLWESLAFALTGVLVLLVSCFNYITISLGAAARRLKEIGIRKTAGAEKKQLVMQFLAENLVLCGLALPGGLVIASTVTIPLLDDLVTVQIPFDFMGNLGFWIFLGGLLAFIGLVSGMYPAFYISSFQPITILRGKLKLAEKKGLTRALTVMQFVLAILTICFSTFIASLDEKLLGGDWGYDEARILVVPVSGPEQYIRLYNDAVQLHNVGLVAGAEHHIGSTRKRVSIVVEGEEKQVMFFGVGPSYFASMGLRVEAGRAFGKDFSADGSHSVVINRTFAQRRGWAEPIGQEIRIDDQAFSVIGVVEDFVVQPVMGKAQAVVFGLSDVTRYNFLTLRVENATMDQVVASLKTIWEREFPGVSFEYFPQTDVFDPYSLDGLAILLSYLAVFALLISCMGLFGLALQRAAQRIKEIGVRKAMGASAIHVILLVNRSFLVMLGVATLIATPMFYFGFGALLHFAPVEISLGAEPLLISNILVFLLAAMSLATQTHRLIKVNPAEVLRDE